MPEALGAALTKYARSIQALRPGTVYLVGAGPGDLELITLKSIAILSQADVILIDSLANPEVLQFARAEAEIIEVGKRCGVQSTPQDEINNLLIKHARLGRRVVRLKGGDPCIFARGGEEMLALAEAGIEVVVASGLTAGIAIPAALNIPLTHRDLAQSLIFTVGNSKVGGDQPNWSAIAASHSTIVIYMGLNRARKLANQLMESGLDANTPAAAVQDGTLPGQAVVLCTLSELADRIEEQKLVSPTLVIIGKVVALSPLWRQSLPARQTQGGTLSRAQSVESALENSVVESLAGETR